MTRTLIQRQQTQRTTNPSNPCRRCGVSFFPEHLQVCPAKKNFNATYAKRSDTTAKCADLQNYYGKANKLFPNKTSDNPEEQETSEKQQIHIHMSTKSTKLTRSTLMKQLIRKTHIISKKLSITGTLWISSDPKNSKRAPNQMFSPIKSEYEQNPTTSKSIG